MEATRTNMRWSEAEEKALRVCAGKVPINVIAEKLHRTQSAVRTKARYMGLFLSVQNRWPDAVDTVRAHKARGLTRAETAEAMGISVESLSNGLASSGLKWREL